MNSFVIFDGPRVPWNLTFSKLSSEFHYDWNIVFLFNMLFNRYRSFHLGRRKISRMNIGRHVISSSVERYWKIDWKQQEKKTKKKLTIQDSESNGFSRFHVTSGGVTAVATRRRGSSITWKFIDPRIYPRTSLYRPSPVNNCLFCRCCFLTSCLSLSLVPQFRRRIFLVPGRGKTVADQLLTACKWNCF